MPTTARLEVGLDAVDAAADPLGPFAGDLVAHGVGQRLDRGGTRQPVAVPVQELVQLSQRQRSVAGEDGEARGPEATPGQQLGPGRKRRQRRLVVVRGSTPLLPRDDRPEQVPRLVELIDQRPAFGGQRLDLGVDDVQPFEQIASLHVKVDPDPDVQARDGPGVDRRVLRRRWRRRGDPSVERLESGGVGGCHCGSLPRVWTGGGAAAGPRRRPPGGRRRSDHDAPAL
jgi:hypothetical protein